jgi:hypothetical protein
MSLSLLDALLEPRPEDSDPGSELEGDVGNWIGKSPERKELMLQALYQALNEVLYEQASRDPEARAMKDPEKPQPGRAVGSLLARAVSDHPSAHSLAPYDIPALRKQLRHELREHYERLKKQFDQGSYGAGSSSSS